MKANAIHVSAMEQLSLAPIEVPEPLFNEVRIQTKACGLCCWDSWLYRGVNAPGPMPYAIGHEAVGIVEKAGAGITHVKPGDKVFCASGSNVMMCEYVTLPGDCVCKLPDATADWGSAVIEPNCCVVNLLYKTDIEPGDHVVLVGAGYMGQLTLMGLTRASAAGRITVFELREDRREMAKAYGPIEIADPASDDGRALIASIQAAGGADVVIDFGASESGLALADSLVRKAGKLIIGSFHRGKITFDGTKWHLGGRYVYNLAPMSNDHYTEILPRTAALIKRGVYEPGKLLTHTARYDDLAALEQMFRASIDKSDSYIKGAVLFD